MPFDIRCSGCGETEEISDSLLIPTGWSDVIVKTHGGVQAKDVTRRANLCPQCSLDAMDDLLESRVAAHLDRHPDTG